MNQPAAGEMTLKSIDQAVKEVFSDPVFQEGMKTSGGGSEDLLAAIYRALMLAYERLRDLIRSLFEDSPGLFWTIFAALLLILLAILIHIGWTFSLAFRGLPRGEQEGRATKDKAHRFRDLRLEARKLAQEGGLSQAARILLLALLALLEEHRILKVAIGWTNREIISRLRPHPDLAGDLQEFALSVEKIFYGGKATCPDDFQNLDALLDRIVERLPAGGVQPAIIENATGK